MDTWVKVFEIAHRVRRIVEELSPSIYNPMVAFPAGLCQDCLKVLGKLLEEKNEHGFTLVFGMRGEHGHSTHVWRELGDFVVDITDDQFGQEATSPVIVSTESSWHEGWQRTEHELDEIDAWRIQGMLYDAIKSRPERASGSLK